MELKELNQSKVCDILNTIVEYEMAGVVRYAHSSLMVTGPYRIPIVQFLQEQANESLQHALQAGELITGLDGHPSQIIAPIDESHDHSILRIVNLWCFLSYLFVALCGSGVVNTLLQTQ